MAVAALLSAQGLASRRGSGDDHQWLPAGTFAADTELTRPGNGTRDRGGRLPWSDRPCHPVRRAHAPAARGQGRSRCQCAPGCLPQRTGRCRDRRTRLPEPDWRADVCGDTPSTCSRRARKKTWCSSMTAPTPISTTAQLRRRHSRRLTIRPVSSRSAACPSCTGVGSDLDGSALDRR